MVHSIFILLEIQWRNISVDELSLLEEFEKEIAQQKIETEALLYVTGYVAHRFRSSHPYLGVPTATMEPLDKHDLLSCLSRGNCIYPSESFLSVAKIMEEEFLKFHGSTFSTESGIFDKLTNCVMARVDCNVFPQKIIHCLVRTRTYIRLRNINLKIKEKNTLRRGKQVKKKMKRITNKIV